ncbi:Basic-leucine zipper transcription factor [Parasponia andersonii]|uniref:Basic-leucine zipper transcription factor n=1 Tax=Parasponia andersonii TaxID=3476 RepID=A0A2P5BXJ0_PARAD|nr:Basic-leucine zipper transcription factor [Parasponia andersonii]
MLSSSDGEEIENSSTSTTTKSRSLQRISSSSSKKSSSSSTSSRSSSTSPNTTTRTMEEVWKDINLSSLSESTTTTVATPQPIRTRHTPTSAANFRSMIFQDFLGRPFRNDSPPTTMVTTSVPPPAPATLYGPSATVSPLPHPATALSLNSGPEFHFLDTSPSDLLRPNSHHLQSTNPISNISSFATPFESLGPTSCLLPSFGKKRFPSSGDSSGSGNRRHKRMIKNRESAARSRARKQERSLQLMVFLIEAYTNELELEVAHLTEENARLRKEQEQFHQAAATTNQLPKKHTLHRTSTAPF